MQLKKIALSDTHSFSAFFLRYISGADVLKPFYHRFPTLDNFAGQITEKSTFPASSRKILVETLQRQYEPLTTSDLVKSNINLLAAETTFTVTTGHQLSIFTGPLYVIYKIVTTINACRRLKEKYPAFNFVPVYWMASEDHDFEEIRSFRLYGKKYVWKNDQKGAVGKLDTVALQELLKEIPGNTDVFAKAYRKNRSLSEAVRFYMNDLFGKEGLVVLDADDRQLKTLLRGVMKEDLTDHVCRSLVDSDTAKLKAAGFHTQVTARDVNFFYLGNGFRERIESDGDGFHVVDHEERWSHADVEKLIEDEPERLSPNVILRPLYQEIILPNLAYIGGPSEVVYWLQLKSLFHHFKIPFPILMPRNFALILEAPQIRKFEKTGLELKDLFETKDFLFNLWTQKNSTQNLSLQDHAAKIRLIFEGIEKQAGAIDPTLAVHIAAKSKQVLDQVGIMEKKMLRSEKRKMNDKLKQIESLKDALFPNGSLQERTDNFLNFYQPNPRFITDLLGCFNPFDYALHALLYD